MLMELPIMLRLNKLKLEPEPKLDPFLLFIRVT